MTRRFISVLVVALLAACGDEAELPPDPYLGMWDDPSDFPRDACLPGSLAGFAEAAAWPSLGLRTTVEGDELHVFLDDVEVPHTLSDDDLFVRRSWWDGTRWRLRAIDVCDVLADVVGGQHVLCIDQEGLGCFGPYPFGEAALHRIEGEDEGEGLSLIGAWTQEAGHGLNVRVADDVAYLALGDGGLAIVSIADEAAPEALATFGEAGDYYNDVKLLDVGGRRYALVGGTAARLVDVTDPSDPRLVATLDVAPHTFFIEGTLAYLVDGSTPTLWVYDLADPAAPVLRDEYASAVIDLAEFHDLYVEDGVAYVSASTSGLAVIDCRDPDRCGLQAFEEFPRGGYWHSPWLTTLGGRPIIVHGDEYTSVGVRLQDVDPASPTFMATIGTWELRDETSAHNVMAFGERVYMAHYHDGIRVLDLADPAAPQMIAYFNTWPDGGPGVGALGLDVDLARRRIYVADWTRGLLILEGGETAFP